MSELPGFETFTKRMTSLGKKPYVTVQKRGLLSLNKAAHSALGEPTAVELLYNRETQVIAIRAVSEDVTHAYQLRTVGGSGNSADASTYLIGATAFTKHYEIPAEVSVRRQVDVRDQVLFVDLRTEGVVVTSNRSAKSAAAETPSET